MVGKDLIMATLFGSGGGSSGSGGGGNIDENDGATYLYITLAEGRTSPMLGVCVNGTVTVDWGDGTEPDVLTGTSIETKIHTGNHEYAKPGDYVIRLSTDGAISFRAVIANGYYNYVLMHAPDGDRRNVAYENAIRRVKIGNNMPEIGPYMFENHHAISSVAFSDGEMTIGKGVFYKCNALANVVIPGGGKSISSDAFRQNSGCAYYDFTASTAVPALTGSTAFAHLSSDCEIRVPAALYDEWIAATNWAIYASQIKAY